MSSEEDRARALLREMQVRLVAGPTAALGVGVHASPADIRHAWLELTKKYHPARFGRMAQEVQRQSNEVFLALKAAHETLAKPKPARNQSPSSPPPNRPATKPFGVPIQPTTPPQGMRPPNPAQRTAPQPRVGAPATPPGRQPSPTTPPPTAPPAAARPAAPAKTGQSQPIPRLGPAAVQPTQPLPRVAASTSTGEALDPALAPILEMIARGEWDRAQQAIDSLSLRNPQSKRYQAMASYCRGRRAMSERRFDDARVEFHTATMQDGTLDIAKNAITELMIAARRR